MTPSKQKSQKFDFFWIFRLILVRWTGNYKITRQKDHRSYQKIHTAGTFPIELSYSEVLTTVFTVITFGFMMPMLFVTSFLQLVVIYLRDKLLCKTIDTPPNPSDHVPQIGSFPQKCLQSPKMCLLIV